MPTGVPTSSVHVIVTSVFFILIFSLFPSRYWADEVYNVTSSQPLAHGDTLVSPSQVFELGFFTPNSSDNLYVGLWHKSIFPRKYVWVANRDNPLAVTDTSATLRISKNGNLELVDGKKTSIWSTNVSVSSNVSAAVIWDNGSFVLKDDMGAALWQSVDYPSDSLLPYMFFGFDSNTGKWISFTSWKGLNDPSTGVFSVGLSALMPTQVIVWKNGSTPHWRSGPWDKSKFVGIPGMDTEYLSVYNVEEDFRKGTRYFSYGLYNNTFAYMDISYDGLLQIRVSENGGNWPSLHWAAPASACEIYGACGPFGFCNTSEPQVCKCLKGFVPKSAAEWSKRNWTGGCVRQTKLSCERNTDTSVSSSGKKDEFWKMVNSKIPDFHEYMLPLSEDVNEDCEAQCLSNCSCLAYAYVNNIGCLVWTKDLIDINVFISDGEELFIRLAHADSGDGKRTKLIVSLITVISISILVSIVFAWKRSVARKEGNSEYRGSTEVTTTMPSQSIDPTETSRDSLLDYIRERDRSEQFMYDFNSIFIATNHFSSANKLGEGGFGPVYKGMLPDGKEIAVKRLSRSSGQGVEEFKNEMLLISKLQHKNLVKIMGCCVTEDEKLLIYEFMANKSLDTLLFDHTRRAELNWDRRLVIIKGVARGLLYLHHDSSLKVIHRDLKVSNILLDEKMNPKISDFGLARIVQGTKNQENTHKVVGTLGYMSPEYAMRGIFSEKSDVYSFGVLVLEIISGRKINYFYHNDQLPSLLAYAWDLWSEDRGHELVDEVLADAYSSSEVMRCLQIGLLCIQDNAVDRPGMPEVILMLSSNTDVPRPMQPIFTFQNTVSTPTWSGSEATITHTKIEGR